MVFGVQKVGFYIAKVWFLFFKRVFFVLQYTIPRPRTPPKWHCNFPSLILQCSYFYLFYPTFRHVHSVGVGVRFIVPAPTKFHKMVLRIPTVDIAILLFYLLYPTFCHVHSVGVGADLSCPYPRIPTKWRCVFPPLILQYLVPRPRNSTKWHCNSHHFAISKPFGSD